MASLSFEKMYPIFSQMAAFSTFWYGYLAVISPVMVSKVGTSLFSFTTRIDGVGSSNFCAITANSDISLSWTASRIKVMSAS